jgi:hypothetical protein
MKSKGTFFVLLLIFLLAGCGSTNTNGGTPPSPTVLHVIRISSNPYGMHVAPFDRTVTDTAAVQQLYTTAQGLPAAKGTYDCAKDLGLVYHLNFLQGTTPMQQMDLEASGCGFLHISKTDARLINSSFVSLFTRTIGIPSLIPFVP